MKFLGTILLLAFLSTLTSAQLLVEDFNYTAGDSLRAHGWTITGTSTVNTIKVTTPGLTYTGYLSGGIGNAATLANNGQDLNKGFANQTSGSVYTSFLVNVTASQIGSYLGDYFFHTTQGLITSNAFYGRVFVRSADNGNLTFGITKTSVSASAPTIWSDSIYTLNTTYLIVLKYKFNTGSTTDDQVSLFVFADPTLPNTEPATPTVGPITTTQTDATGLDLINLRQGSATAASAVIIDGIRVGTTWNEIFFSTFVSKASINFGNVNLSTSSVDSFYVKNLSTSTLSLASVSSSNPVFTVIPATATIAAADSQEFVVTYTPTSVVTSSDTIVITPSGSTSSMIVTVSGSGVQAGFSATPTSIDFGKVWKDSTATDTVTVTNASTSASLVIDSVLSSNSLFVVSPTSGTVGISSSTKFAINFKPTAKGAATANVIFYHNAPSHRDTVKVSGNGILKEPLFSATPTSINFGAVLNGQSKMDSVVIKNIGYDSLFISNVVPTDTIFVVTPTTARLDTSASQKFYVTFKSNGAGHKSASVVFTSNVSELTDTVAVTGNGLGGVTIAEARKDNNLDLIADHSVTKDTLVIYGVVTTPNLQSVGSQTAYFIQDATAGIEVFAYSLPSTSYTIGDSVMVLGTVSQYRGLVEFIPLVIDTLHFGIVKHNAKVPTPQHLTLHQLVASPESYEGLLVEVDTLYKASGTWPLASSNGFVYVTNASKVDTMLMFTSSSTNIAGSTERAYPINVIGVISQYSSGSTVYNNGYELEPFDIANIIHTPGTAGVEQGLSGIPTTYELKENYPNPFNPSTTILYGLPQQSRVSVKIYSILGQEVRTLVNDNQNASYYRVTWNGRDNNGMQVSSGVYFFRMIANPVDGKGNAFTQVKKMMLMK